MNLEELNDWREYVGNHLKTLDMLINDRKTLKNLIESHLKLCFDYDDIEYNRDFTVITLKWNRNVSPIIKKENISKLEMDWLIKTDYDDGAFSIVVVEIYPFGIKEDGED